MTVNMILRRTASFLGFGSQELNKDLLADDEIIYRKNNVCVHPPSPLHIKTDHHPGYLTIRTQTDEVLGSTLILTWVPNSTVKKNLKIIENKTPLSSPCRSTRSSASPSPHSPRHFDLGRSNSTSPRISFCSERSHDDFTRIILNSIISDQDRKMNHSFSSTASEMGSPRDDNYSLESWPQSDSGSSNAISQFFMKHTNSQSQIDSGIGVDEMNAALETTTNVLSDLHIGTKLDNELMESASSLSKEIDSNEGVFDNSDNSLNSSNESQSLIYDNCNIQLKNDSLLVVTQPQSEDIAQDLGFPIKDGSKPKMNLDLYLNDDDHSDTLTEDLDSLTACKVNSKPRDKETHGEIHQHNYSLSEQTDDMTEQTDDMTEQTDDVISPSLDESQSFPSTPTEDSFPVLKETFKNHHKEFYLEETPEAVAMNRNLAFPENVSHSTALSPNRREHQCGVFSVDLGQMRSLRMFFSNSECTCGQLVIASRESQYKILHFHCGGLDKLASVFEEWSVLVKPKNKNDICPYRQFSICRPQVTQDECHPEDGIYDMVDEDTWICHMNEDGQIEEECSIRKAIFFGGLDPSIRKDVWPFLLHCYSFLSTHDEREQIQAQRYLEYQEIKRKRENMTEAEQEIFWRNIQCTVEKDVIRTDRSNAFYAGDNNPNVEIMKNILLNYAVYNPFMGYTQGMSDLLAPVLVEIQNEVDAFWCFVGLMQRTIFFSSPKDLDMDRNLNYLRELIRLMVPKFYDHLKRKTDGLELLFSHRWILLCFKREFPEVDALKMWEACWSNYQTDYFHLFLCLAIIAVYGDDVIQQDLPSDEMLLHFSSLAMHMDGGLILRKARGLLHQYRKMPNIPCTLHDLCEICGPGMWDSGHVPIIVCVGNHGDHVCPYGGQELNVDNN